MYGEWSRNTEIFIEFLENCLCPELKPFHKGIFFAFKDIQDNDLTSWFLKNIFGDDQSFSSSRSLAARRKPRTRAILSSQITAKNAVSGMTVISDERTPF